MSIYRKKARYFIYSSKNLSEIDNFAKDSSIEVMIINIQAFNARDKDARKIRKELDEFQSRRPIDVIAKTRPILILDEPQKMGGDATKDSIVDFNPLFTLNYSAMHREHHNLVYVLDALDAYNQKLVKKIQVKGIKVDKVKGTQAFLYLDEVRIREGNLPPQALMSYSYKKTDGKISTKTRLMNYGDDIYELSGGMAVYRNQYIIKEIDRVENCVRLLNGIEIHAGEVIGDDSEETIRRIQIRETIASHLEKEKENFHKGIKTLSLFFIDEVKKYRDYSQPDEKGVYAHIFEDEYKWAVANIVNDTTNADEEYKTYLSRFMPEQVHKGYFSVDKKGHAIDSKEDRKTGISDDESAYDLILKNKERLLSFEEPTRFIFSHSALREGWDNPNVFQICTLRHTKSGIQKRQEVGRGLRIAVDKNGNREDATVLTDFFAVNKLTVIANEDYAEFTAGLQSEISEVLYKRPLKANKEFFLNKPIVNADSGDKASINDRQANVIHNYLVKNDYVDDDDKLTEKYRTAVGEGTRADLPEGLKPYQESIFVIIDSIPKGGKIDIEDAKKPKVVENKLNANFQKKEFQELWRAINHKYTYRVHFNSEELIHNCIESLKKDLAVSKITYSVQEGEQKDTISKKEIESGSSFEESADSGRRRSLGVAAPTTAKYDLVHEIAQGTHLTRRTIARILIGVKEKLQFFRDNPEEYIANVINLINAQKASVVVKHISYNQLQETFSDDIFNESHKDFDSRKALKSSKAVQDFIFTDGTAASGDSNEMKFAKSLESQADVKVYAKMPKSFYIPTPMGSYSPDWAIVYEQPSGEKGVYFVAETKGSLDSLQLRKIEAGKIDCARALYNRKGSILHYGQVHVYQDLVDQINRFLTDSEK